MEQSFALKHHGQLSLFEQNHMTGEERAWWMKRLDKEFTQQKQAMEKNRPNIPRRR